MTVEAPPKRLIKPDHSIRHFTFGYHENIVDGLWIRLLQDYDYCEQNKKAKAGVKEGDQAHTGQNRVQNCEEGWVFHMLDVIMEMAPRFRMPAATGGVMLSVLVDDIQGATQIFNRSVKNFPNDWAILYRAAYHFLYEEEDLQRAAELLIQAGENGAPRWVYSLAARLYTKRGQAILAKTVLEQILSEVDIDADYATRLRQRLNKINDELKKESQKGP